MRRGLAGGGVRVEVEGASGTRKVFADDVLAALGRTPDTEGADLHAAGVELDERGFVRVDERLRTSEPGTFAVGDVTGGPQFTHVSLDDYRVVKSSLNGGARSTDDRLMPYCVFIDPELGRIGLTERDARRLGHEVRIAKLPASAVPRAKTLGATRGLLKAVVERGSDRILGAAILAPTVVRSPPSSRLRCSVGSRPRPFEMPSSPTRRWRRR